MDDCNEIMSLGLADVSHMSIFNDFDGTDRNMFHGRIIDEFSMITVHSTTADNHEVLWVLVLMIRGMIPGLTQPCTLAK